MADTKTATKPSAAASATSGRDYPAPRGPDFIVYAVRDRDGARALWTRIGAAFKHDKGPGVNILLDALPMGRKIVLMEPKEDDGDVASQTGF